NELTNLEKVIISSLDLLDINKKLIIITFNSLESTLIKSLIKTNTINKKKYNLKKIYPNKEELIFNKSSRSATMYVIKKS
ncbi:16S rRNA (cytosine(1402)-N(4))-methyltransferase, partial [Streptomyces narbonensis]